MMMGPLLKRKLEQDLNKHLNLLGCDFLTNYVIDLEQIIAESEVLRRIKDGWCSDYSSVKIQDSNGQIICTGNVSYFITDSREPLFWWEHLSLKDESSWKEICFYEYEFPIHIWNQLSDIEKNRFNKLNEIPNSASNNIFQAELMEFLQEKYLGMH